jgi:hypothetical protein
MAQEVEPVRIVVTLVNCSYVNIGIILVLNSSFMNDYGLEWLSQMGKDLVWLRLVCNEAKSL